MAMFKRIAAPLVLVTALACAGPVLAADPTSHQVYEAANSGHLEQAQQMMTTPATITTTTTRRSPSRPAPW